MVSEADVRALLQSDGGIDNDEDDVDDKDDERLFGDAGERKRERVVWYSPDKLCPACRPLFNASELERRGRGEEGVRLVDAMREVQTQDLFFLLLGDVLRALFRLAPQLEARYRERWWGGAGPESVAHSVGVQIRRGRWHMGSKSAADDRGLLSDEGEAHLLSCARALAQPGTHYFLVTDDVTARERAVAALAPHPVHFLQAPIVHSGLEGQGEAGQRGVFLDWWILGDVTDAGLWRRCRSSACSPACGGCIRAEGPGRRVREMSVRGVERSA